MEFLNKIKAKSEGIYTASPVTIAFLGDSVTQGCFEVYTSKHGWLETIFDAENGYPSKLLKILRTVYSRVPFNMINAGLSGADTVIGLSRLERDILVYKPDLTIVCYGLNDCTKGENFLNEYCENLRTIFKKLKEIGSDVIFMTPNMMCTEINIDSEDKFKLYQEKTAEYQNSGILDLYMQKAKDIATEQDVLICDCYQIWKNLYSNGSDINLLLENKMNHPTREMHWLFANMLFNTIHT